MRTAYKIFLEGAKIISSIVVYLTAISSAYDWFQNNKQLFFYITPFLIIGAIITANYIKRALHKIYTYKSDLEIQKDVERQKKLIQHDSIEKIVPQNRIVKLWYENVLLRSKLWSKDATLIRLNLFINVSSYSVTSSITAFFESKWKPERLVVFDGSMKGNSFEEKDGTTNNKVLPIHLHKNWRKAIIKAYEQIENRISGGYDIHVLFFKKGHPIWIWTTFTEGRIRKQINFEFDGKYLTGNKSKNKIKL